MRGDLDISVTVHHSTSIPNGLMELASQHNADLVVVGSSSSGLLGRVALGSVTERLVHTSKVPVAIAPRGYPSSPVPVQRLTAAYRRRRGRGGPHRHQRRTGEAVEGAAADRVVHGAAVHDVRRLDRALRRGARRSAVDAAGPTDAAVKQLDEARATVSIPDVDVVIGTGTEWREAVDDIAWEPGDVLLLGSGAAGPLAQVFLGTAASKILRHAPVPVMIVPRRISP